MKRMAIGMALLLLLSGCAQTQPETAPTTLQQAQQVREATAPKEDLNLPARYTGDWEAQEGRLTIHADAPITTNQGTQLPMALVERRRLRQQDLDRLLKAFAKGNPCYNSSIVTKQFYQESMDILQKNIDSSGLTQERAALMEEYQRKLEAAPDEKDLPAVTEFWMDDAMECPVFYAKAQVDGVGWKFEIIDNGKSMCWASIYRKDYGTVSESILKQDEGLPIDIKLAEQFISAEAAQAIGDDLMEKLGLQYMACDDIRQASNGAQRLYYVPSVNGIRLSCIPQEVFGPDGTPENSIRYRDSTAQEESNSDDIMWYNEKVRLEIGTDGVLAFFWEMPCRMTELVTENAALLPFEKIQEIADIMLPEVLGQSKERTLTQIDNINGFTTLHTANIDRVDLTLMRIRDKGSTQGRVVPVWDFWGATSAKAKEPEYAGPVWAGSYHEVLLTLNAIDGSVIDRALGY